MAKKVKKKFFNLLEPVAEPITAWDRIYDWLLGKARTIIMIVELFIVGAFISKFVVDTQAKAKEKAYNEYRQRESFFSITKEPEYRSIQTKGNNYVLLWNGSSSKYAILSEVYSYISANISELSISVNDDKVTVSGYDDLSKLQSVEESFKKSETFSDAYIDDLTLQSEDVQVNKGRYSLVGIINKDLRTRADL